MKIDMPDIASMLGMHAEAIADADVVLAVDNVVLKDKNGHGWRPATPDEIAGAELLRRW